MPYREDPADALSDLTDEEAHAFVVLVRTVARADGGVSDAERAQLASFAAEMGEERFWPLVEQTRGATGRPAVEQAARQVARPSARELIFATLTDLAISGTIVEPEAAVLDWLADLWNLQVRNLDDD